MRTLGIESDGLAVGYDPSYARLVHQPAQLAQAPAQCATRIVRQVPQQRTQALASVGPPGYRQIGQQGARLARGRQRDGDSVARDPHFAKEV